MQWVKTKFGFTIVELLIVIVIIVILATITVVTYSGIQNQAESSVIQSDLASVARKLETFKIQNNNGMYPSNLTEIDITIQGMTYYYSTSDNTYCLSKTSSTISFHNTSRNSRPVSGLCGSVLPLASWSLNGNAVDSINSFNGTVIGAIPAVGQSGLSNTAYQFNGTSTEINLPIPTTRITDVTVTAWIFVETTSKGAIFHVGNNGGGYSLGLGDGFESQNHRLVGLFPGKRWIPAPTIVSEGWHHVGIRLDSDSTPTFFLDGEMVGTPYPGILPEPPLNLVVLGRNTGDEGMTPATRMFTGRIDDVRFYDISLSGAEVKGLFVQGAQ